ncbi:MAG: ring-hydroxylating oxygenase subunit alpha [Acidiferrobacterales bacterium]|nr:ring-hydroxylating oxygenase subunit alpha [Acidiferrobacterales bacterium]
MMNATLSRQQIELVRQGFDPQPQRSSSINKICYIDPHYLEVEREHVFKKSWQFVCHEEKLRNVGDYVCAEIQGHSIFVVRSDDGNLKAFYNVCQHRAHELLQGEGSTQRITCPYHAWVYRLDGTLVRARGSEHLENFDVSKICLTSIGLETFCNFVFVNLDRSAPSLALQTENLENEITSFAPDIARLTFAHRLTYRVQANWKAVVDNFLECYHCPVAHRDFCSLIDMQTYQVRTHGIYSSHMAKAKSANNDAYSIENASVDDHAVWYLWPNMTLMRYPGRGNFMVWRFYPISESETCEIFDFFLETAHPNDEEKEAIRFIDEVLQSEDIALVECVQRGMRTPAFEQGRYMVDPKGSGLSEHAVHHFHSLLLKAYEQTGNP